MELREDARRALVQQWIKDNSSPEPFTGCWLWELAESTPATFLRYSRQRQVRRAAFWAFNGEIPPFLIVRHKCDCSICVNPAHLELGTSADNSRDFATRGRFRPEYLFRDHYKTVTIKPLACQSGLGLTTHIRGNLLPYWVIVRNLK